jgi:hypothetical protein
MPPSRPGRAMIARCRVKGLPPFIPMGRIFRGGALAERGELTTGIAELAEGIAGVRGSGTEHARSLPTWPALVQRRQPLLEAAALATDLGEPSEKQRQRATGTRPGRQVPGAARRHQPGSPVGRFEVTGRGPGPPGAGVWLVHRGLRDRRSEGRQGPARPAGQLTQASRSSRASLNTCATALARSTVAGGPGAPEP